MTRGTQTAMATITSLFREATMTTIRTALDPGHLVSVARQIFAALTLLALLVAPAIAQAQEAVEYYATDALGSVRVVFDASGNVIARSDYLPFGEQVAATGNLPTQRFTGQQRDEAEGFDFFNARSLQTRTGRMNRVDPVFAGLFLPQKWNRYSHAINNPITIVDPSGEDPIKPDFRVTVTAPRPGEDPVLALLSLMSGWAHFNGGDYGATVPQFVIDEDLFTHGTGPRFVETIQSSDEGAELSADEIHTCDGCIPSTGAPDPFQPNNDFVSGLINAGGLTLGSVARSLFNRSVLAVASTFAGRIHTKVLRSDVTAYRYFGNEANEIGRWLTTRQTTRQISGPSDAIRLLNLPRQNSATDVSTFIIPAGTRVHIGRVAGGGSQATQIVVPDPRVLVKP